MLALALGVNSVERSGLTLGGAFHAALRGKLVAPWNGSRKAWKSLTLSTASRSLQGENMPLKVNPE
jgi:hypothetical protein